MLVVSPVPKRDRNNPLRRVFSCLQSVNYVVILVRQLHGDMKMNHTDYDKMMKNRGLNANQAKKAIEIMRRTGASIDAACRMVKDKK